MAHTAVGIDSLAEWQKAGNIMLSIVGLIVRFMEFDKRKLMNAFGSVMLRRKRSSKHFGLIFP
jgi:hypothetical protein